MADQEPQLGRLVPLGAVVGTHALRGELRVRLFNPTSAALQADTIVVLRRAGMEREWRISGVRRHKQQVLMLLEGCASIDAAQQLVGCDVCVREQNLPPAAAGEVYHYELVDMTVVTTTGIEIGRIAEVLATPSNDVCVVRSDAGEYLIPVIADVIKHIDRTARRLTIEPLPGLLEP